MAYTIRLAMAAVMLLLPAIGRAESRTWTDQSGRTIQAEFVRVDDQQVVLLMNGQEFTVPLARLSDSDRQWLLDRQPGSDATATDSSATGLKAVRNVRLKSKRTWTETGGRKTTAEFVRVHQRNVVLAVGGRVKMIPFHQFTSEDQDYIKQLLRQGGEDAVADDLDRTPAPVAIAANAGQTANSRPSYPSVPRPPSFPGPGGAFDRMQQHMDETRRDVERRNQEMQQRLQRQREEREQRRQETERELAAAQRERELERQQEQERQRQEEDRQQREREERLAQSFTPPATRPPTYTPPRTTPGTPPTFTPPSASSPYSDYADGYCSECGEDISSRIGAGDRCPHCGVYFEYEEDDSGNRSYASDSSSNSFRIRRFPVRGLVTLVLLLGGGLAALVRRILW